MEIPDDLLCLFTAELEEKNGSYIIEVPAREVSKGQLQPDQTYCAAVVQTEPTKQEVQTRNRDQPDSAAKDSEDQSRNHEQPNQEPPVEKGEQRTVEIEDLGDQGDGITRVERGYVVIVPDTEPNERVRIEITDVSENVGFAEVVERKDYYE
ncbi:TRAM domain-containing protein [Halopiger xanaduensis]|uniref:Deoxyribonuclease/rho motif-related TRAM n=1 Tax=Halopiger xanaduensis (strain DSM 18323 / JCM 14033 / SH-6) TaxID=797210 RepID=F8DDX1_HALXS|nr:TRAM domain-containing protein [Halopiger xanaduensis]AEH39225.1 deoxyribonuclease/rho motif-related TRAM [Halopiger xanaduensis SH-6]